MRIKPYNRLQQLIFDNISEVVQNAGCYVHSINYHKSKLSQLTIEIDKSDRRQGITIEECAKIGSALRVILDVAEIIHNKYSLTVTSPGAERELHNLKDFQDFYGQYVKLLLVGGISYIGKILDVHENQIKIELADGKVTLVNFSEIVKANLTLVSNKQKRKKL